MAPSSTRHVFFVSPSHPASVLPSNRDLLSPRATATARAIMHTDRMPRRMVVLLECQVLRLALPSGQRLAVEQGLALAAGHGHGEGDHAHRQNATSHGCP